MKYLVVIALAGLLLMLLTLSYRKLRPYLLTLRNFIHAVRQFQNQAGRSKNRGEPEKLVCCATCGVWVPQTRALPAALSGDLRYCSDTCLRGKRKATH